jgi:hypothetical protein
MLLTNILNVLKDNALIVKKLLLLLFSFFLLSSPSVFADDTSNFQIEGISLGDSLLDYMTEEEILEEMELNKDFYSHLKEPNKYAEVFLFDYSSIYESGLSFYIKNNSQNQYVTNKEEKYTILFVRGRINYIEDFDSCIAKRDEIAEILSEMFPNAPKRDLVGEHSADSSGDSIIDAITFKFASGDEISATCFNFEETFRINNNMSEGLSVAIASAEILRWHRD